MILTISNRKFICDSSITLTIFGAYVPYFEKKPDRGIPTQGQDVRVQKSERMSLF